MIANPLAKYFRVPGVHIQLPTRGAFMPPGSIEFTMNDDLPVYPMRAADELLLKSPDALMSGYAIEKLLESCVPSIKAPRLVSSPDLDVLLLAIRAATYGETIETATTCPACGAETVMHTALPHLITNMTTIEPENPVRLSDEIVAYMRPYNLTNATVLGVASFEEMRKIQAVETAESSIRLKQMNQSMEHIGQLTIRLLSDCIIKMVIPEGIVSDPEMIREFVDNISKQWSDRLQAKLDEINSGGINKNLDIKCPKCNHEWQSQIEFDPATFFAAAS